MRTEQAMDSNSRHLFTSRRELLKQTATGFGWLALVDLLARTTGSSAIGTASASNGEGSNGLALKPPHFHPRAQRVIFLFTHGGVSHMDSFDYKPLLQRDHGKPLPFALPRVVSATTGNLLASPWKFSRHGQSGAWVSEIFPYISRCVDDLCIIRSMYCSNSRHGGACLELHTGEDTYVRPSMGSWLSYGLGTENQNLPGYITICPVQTHGGAHNWGAAFLPAIHQGTPLGDARTPAEKAKIPFSTNADTPARLQRLELDLLRQMSQDGPQQNDLDSVLESRIEAFELAFRLQSEAPGVQDISGESAETRALYGLDDDTTKDFGHQCLMARRFSERGVRFVQVYDGYWDQHSRLKRDMAQNAAEIDKPIHGLLRDLKQRGLLDDTLVLCASEFGRTPVAQGTDGRDHNPHGFTIWLAGGGIKPGIQYGATDDYGYYAVENKIHFHDLHATILHLMGLEHTRLTYRHGGRDFRLTDVHGKVVHDIIA